MSTIDITIDQNLLDNTSKITTRATISNGSKLDLITNPKDNGLQVMIKDNQPTESTNKDEPYQFKICKY